MAMIKPIPEGYSTLTTSLVVNDAARAIDYYTKAFGAKLEMRLDGPDGRIMHAEIRIGDTRLMLCEPCPKGTTKSPESVNATTCSLYLYTEDVDSLFNKAISAGGKSRMEVSDTFWGDRMGIVTDPFGHVWSLATHKVDLTQEQIRLRAEEFFASTVSA